jgi:hypothetical protein
LSLYGAGQLTGGRFGHKIAAEHMLSRLEVPEIVVKVPRFLPWCYLNDSGGPMMLLTGFLSCAAAMLVHGDSRRITGRVLDPTGAVVVTVQVTATEQDTGVAYKAVSSALGVYAVAFARFLDGRPVSGSASRAASPCCCRALSTVSATGDSCNEAMPSTLGPLHGAGERPPGH